MRAAAVGNNNAIALFHDCLKREQNIRGETALMKAAMHDQWKCI